MADEFASLLKEMQWFGYSVLYLVAFACYIVELCRRLSPFSDHIATFEVDLVAFSGFLEVFEGDYVMYPGILSAFSDNCVGFPRFLSIFRGYVVASLVGNPVGFDDVFQTSPS